MKPSSSVLAYGASLPAGPASARIAVQIQARVDREQSHA